MSASKDSYNPPSGVRLSREAASAADVLVSRFRFSDLRNSRDRRLKKQDLISALLVYAARLPIEELETVIRQGLEPPKTNP